ncbi:MAG: NADH-quinone oxidoreductase subunit N [Nitrospiraceae bacterium]
MQWSDFAAILPELLVMVAACAILVLDPITSAARKDSLAWIGLATLGICTIWTAAHMDGRVVAFSGHMIVDGYGGFWKLLLYLMTGLTILLSLAYLKAERIVLGEYYGFLLLALCGMMVMVSAADLLTLYLGMELMALSLYVLAGIKRYEARSLEAAAKYFVLGAFSSGILLYGISLLFGATGSTKLDAIAAAASSGTTDPMLMLAMILLVVGFGFKLAAAPFHMWTPDVYEGSPTAVTAFMSVASKAASFAAFLRVFVEALGGIKSHWVGILIAVCLATLAIGNLVALVQTNIKRLLAYSSIAHAGYALVGVAAIGNTGSGADTTQSIASVMLYLFIYAFMTMGAFAIVGLLRRNGVESEDIDSFAGLAKREPVAAFLMMIFMVSLAGLPPTAGFIGKLYLFMAAVHAGLTWLALSAVVFAAISAYYYLRIVMAMYMREPEPHGGDVPAIAASPALTIVLTCATAGVIILGLFPGPLVALATHAMLAIR